jgi:putative aminopeptidase FrvX
MSDTILSDKILSSDQNALLDVTRRLLECPTAPTFEDRVRAEIKELLADLEQVSVAEDRFGNLIAFYRGSDEPARFAFAAHMDHPGWRLGPDKEFLGSVPGRFLGTAPIREFGAFGMWDLPAFVLDGDRIHSRACDDLIGCAVIIAMLRDLAAASASCSVYALFTRAEEVGFIGAIQFAKSRKLPLDVTVISVETSAERPPARIGDGPIIRVGDRTSVFDPVTTEWFVRIAESRNRPYQRCLMAGGTCEGTAFQTYGYRSGALCIALGNYHNCAPDDRIETEYVSLSDMTGLIELCAAIARNQRSAEDLMADRKRKFEELLLKYPLQ